MAFRAGRERAVPLLSRVPAWLTQTWREATILGLVTVILVFLAAFSLYITQRSIRESEIAEALTTFNSRLISFVQLLRTLESSQRGYFLTNDEKFLAPYYQKRDEVRPLYESLGSEAPEAIGGAARIRLMEPYITEKLDEMTETLEFAREGRLADAISRTKSGFGRELTSRIEREADAIRMDGMRVIHENAESTNYLRKLKLQIDIFGGLLILFLSASSMYFYARSASALRNAQEALSKTNSELEDLVEERTAALRQANQEIQRFAYIISHDLRSPLVNVMGFTAELELLRKEAFEKLAAAGSEEDAVRLGGQFDEAFQFIKASIARMDRLITAVLTISREGNRPLNVETVDMTGTIQAVISNFAHRIKEEEIEVRVGKLPNLECDRFALEQIFSNLIDNAIKFLKNGERGEIEVSGERKGAIAIFTVQDNGRGVDRKDHQRIFELFRRAGPRDTPGEGMGLAYVAALTRRLGGTIEIQSEAGGGATFILSLPVKCRGKIEH